MVNLVKTNKKGMIFGLLFAAAAMLVLSSVRKKVTVKTFRQL